MNKESFTFTQTADHWEARLADGRKLRLTSRLLGTSKTGLVWTAKYAGLAATGSTRREAVESWIFADNADRAARAAAREDRR